MTDDMYRQTEWVLMKRGFPITDASGCDNTRRCQYTELEEAPKWTV